MLLLALDTSTGPSVALADDGGVRAELDFVDARHHGETLAPAIVSVLAMAGETVDAVSAIVVGVGPGPFTGLRVGLVTARVMAATLGVPIHGVCSLDVLAAQAAGAGVPDEEFLVLTDARRREVYWGRYDASGRALGGPAVDRPDAVAALHPGVRCVGPGTELYPELLPVRGGPVVLSAGALADLALFRMRAGESFLPPDPLYLRRPDATPPAARKPVSTS